MYPEFISQKEMHNRGWNLKSIVKSLDIADRFEPTNHLLNITGTPFYNKERVTVAEYRTGLSNLAPSEEIWNKWKESERPTSFPILDFNFLLISKECIPSAYETLLHFQKMDPDLRFSQKMAEKERELIFKSFISIIEFSSATKIKTRAELEKYLSVRAIAVDSKKLFNGELLNNIVVRAAKRSKFICKYTSKIFMQKFIDSISLVHEGCINGVNNRHYDFSDLIIYSSSLRFDIRSLKTPQVALR